MNLIKTIKKNNGSTLTLVLFMLFMLSVTAIAVVTVTGSELGMSVMTSDRSRALMIAQAGAEKAAQDLDAQVAKAQDEARINTSRSIETLISGFKVNPDSISTTRLKGILELTDAGEVKVLDEDQFNSIYKDNYRYEFSRLMEEWLNNQKSAGGEWNPGVSHLIKKEEIRGDEAENRAGTYIYDSILTAAGNNIINLNNAVKTEIASISIISRGEAVSANGTVYKRSIQAKFGLLTESSGGIEEIPVSYGKLTKIRVNSLSKPTILSGYAVIAEKNIISLDGTAKINGGDAICFGTVPGDANKPDKYKSNLSGYDFGGIMAGITPQIMRNLELDTGLSGSAIGLDIENINDFVNKNHTGSFTIEKSAGTLGYIHTLYSENKEDATSKITVLGDAYARGVKVEGQAHFSELNFMNVYMSDDLRIDANNAKVRIGSWAGTGEDYKVQTGPKGKLVGLSTGKEEGVSGLSYSSAVVVPGDSELYINGSIYMGGSTYFNEYTKNIADNIDEMYPSGLSVLKSGSLPAQAYEMAGTDILPVPDKNSFPGNIFYLYNNNTTETPDDDYICLNDPAEESQILLTEPYIKTSGFDNTTAASIMMQGGKYPNPVNPLNQIEQNPFTIISRAMHFKQIWEQHWKKEVGYSTYMNTGDIHISANGVNKLDGWCNGAVAANNNVYGPYKGFTQADPDEYFMERSSGNKKYAEFMKLFISCDNDDENNAANVISNTPKYTLAGDNITTPVLAGEEDKIIASKSGIMMYYGRGNVVLTANSVNGENFSTDGEGYLKGIIYSDKDIYVKAETKFKGILIAQGNIVFVGGPEIKYDEGVIDTLLSEEPKVARFFKYSPEDLLVNNQSLLATIKKSNVKNIKIMTWKEI